MEEAIAAPVHRIEAAFEIIPSLDFMDGLILDDFLKDFGGRYSSWKYAGSPLVAGDRARLSGMNSVGLRRRGVSTETFRAVKRAFHILFSSKLRFEAAALRVEEELGEIPEVQRLILFLRKSERGFCR